ncbi:MAG: hypothetical protein ACYC7A_22480 [Thermoanaerobaculia bacterium]
MIRSALIAVFIAAAVCPTLAAVGCGGRIDAPSAPATEPTIDSEERSTQKVRVLNSAANKDATELFSRVAMNPADSRLREQLAQTYRDAGEPLVADFFASTAVVLRDHSPHFPTSPPTEVVLCPDPPTEKSNALAASVSAKILAGRYQDALQEADSAREALGGTCVFHPQWASAVVWAYLDSPNSTSFEHQESAIRLLMVLAEAGLYPRTAAGRSAVYDLIAGYFMGRGDGPSAYVALLTAKDRLVSDSPRGVDVSRALGDLDRKIAKARKHVSQAVEASGADPQD